MQLSVHPSFSLAAAASFYRGFTPMAGAASADGGSLTLAFLVERLWTPAVVHLRQEGASLALEARGADEEAVLPQVRRMLGLDVDGDAWVALGARVPQVGALQRAFPGFFTAAFPSPYEAALGGIVAQRTSMAGAAAIRRSLAVSHGTFLDDRHVLPSPAALADLDAVPGLPATKLPWLQALGRAALDGRLDAERLRAMPQEDAVAELRSLPGIGPWTAEHAVLRGAAPPDGLPTAEPRVLRALSRVFGRELDARSFAAAAEAFRPFRMWVSVLAVRDLAASGGWSARPDRRERGNRAVRG